MKCLDLSASAQRRLCFDNRRPISAYPSESQMHYFHFSAPKAVSPKRLAVHFTNFHTPKSSSTHRRIVLLADRRTRVGDRPLANCELWMLVYKAVAIDSASITHTNDDLEWEAAASSACASYFCAAVSTSCRSSCSSSYGYSCRTSTPRTHS